MRFLFDNIDFSSSSGPNSFGRKLAMSLISQGHSVNSTDLFDVQLSFIQASQKSAPLLQRLDGIYFNSDQEWKALNEPIKKTYEMSDGVIFQSKFNQALTEKYFGKKEKNTVIHNGTDLNVIKSIGPVDIPDLDQFENIWSCASSWRPHKRLSENVRYFLEHSSEKDCLVIAGGSPDFEIEHNRIFYCGNLSWEHLISLYKRSKYFLHLALMDHCPNVVVDARASGCQIICASSGGTHEIAGESAVVVKDMDWDFLPFKLYDPPKLDFTKKLKIGVESNLNVNSCAKEYVGFARSVIK